MSFAFWRHHNTKDNCYEQFGKRVPRRFLPFRAFLPLPSPHLFAPAMQANPDEAFVRNTPVVQVRSWKTNKENVAGRSKKKTSQALISTF